MNRETNTRAYDDSRFVLQIVEGGTGATNAQDACINLGAISINDRGQQNGVASLSNDRKVLLSELPFIPGTEAPTIDVINNTIPNFTIAQFNITNYDTQTNYDISANHGQLLRVDNLIYYACNNFIGIDVIQVNTKVFGVNVVSGQQYSYKPNIIAPLANSRILDNELWEVDIQDLSIDNSLINSVNWEINFPDSSQVVVSSGTSLVFNPATLSNAQLRKLTGQCTIRCRLDIKLMGLTQWTDPVVINVINLPAIFDKLLYDDFISPVSPIMANDFDARGYIGALSKDGSTLVISNYGLYCLEVYVKNNDIWPNTAIKIDYLVPNENLLPTGYVANVNSAQLAIAISHTGERIYLGVNNITDNNTNIQTYVVYVYKATDITKTEYIMESCIIPDTGNTIDLYFGLKILLSDDSSKVFILSNFYNNTVQNENQGIHIYSCDNGVHTPLTIINNSDIGISESDSLWLDFSISGNGNRLVISVMATQSLGINKIYLFDNIDNVWTLSLTIDDLSSYYTSEGTVYISEQVALSGDGTVLYTMFCDIDNYINLKVLKYNNNAWVEVDTYQNNSWDYPTQLVCSYAGDILIVGDHDSIPPPVLKHPVDSLINPCGIVWCYELRNDNIIPLDYFHGNTSSSFGRTVLFNETSKEMFISDGREIISRQYFVNDDTTRYNLGAMHIYR